MPLRIIICGVDPVAERLNAPRRGAAFKQGGFGVADQQTGVRTLRNFSLESTQQPAFAAVYPPHEGIALITIAFKFGAIDIDKVHDELAVKIGGHILRHLPRKAEYMADPARSQLLIHPILHGPAGEAAHRYRLPRRQSFQPGLPLGLAPQFHMAGGHKAVHRRRKAHIAGIIGKGSDMHRGHGAQMLQNMVRPYFVASIGWPRNTMRQKQYVAHQPSPLAIQGPKILATGSGNFCHNAICARYFGLFGFMSRGA